MTIETEDVVAFSARLRTYQWGIEQDTLNQAADLIQSQSERIVVQQEALQEMLDAFDGQPMPAEEQAERADRAVWFAVCVLRDAMGPPFNCEGGEVATSLIEARRSVSEFRASLTKAD